MTDKVERGLAREQIIAGMADYLIALPELDSPLEGGFKWANAAAVATNLYDQALSRATDEEGLARVIGDHFSPNVEFDRASHATQAACRRAARAIIAHIKGEKPK